MRGQSRGLVEREDPLILVDDCGTDLGEQRFRYPPRAGFRSHAYRRQPDQVTGLEAPVRARTPAIHAHFALAEQPVDVRARDTLEHPQQEIVEPLACLAVTDLDMPHRGGGYFSGGHVVSLRY